MKSEMTYDERGKMALKLLSDILERRSSAKEATADEAEIQEKPDETLCFIFVFPKGYRNPITDELMDSYWVEVDAESYQLAKFRFCESYYGMSYLTQYWEHEFEEVKSSYSSCYERNPGKVANPEEQYLFPDIKDL